jgi:hypothetical protein
LWKIGSRPLSWEQPWGWSAASFCATRSLKTVPKGTGTIGKGQVNESVAMAVQNLLLKTHELGYGAVVIDTPLAVGSQIKTLLDISADDPMRVINAGRWGTTSGSAFAAAAPSGGRDSSLLRMRTGRRRQDGPGRR